MILGAVLPKLPVGVISVEQAVEAVRSGRSLLVVWLYLCDLYSV